MIVLDASAATTVLLNLGTSSSAAIRERMGRSDASLHVPHLFDVEVLHALRRHTLRGALSIARSYQATEALRSLRAVRYPHAALLPRIWALREDLTAYDAAYVALAETLDAPLVTTDGRLARASGHRAKVELYG